MTRWSTGLWLAGGLWACLPVAGVEGRSIVRIGGGVIVEREMRVGAAVAVGGNVTVRGVVEEDAVAVLGSVLLGPEAVVHGNVVAVAGTIRQQEGAQIRGDIVEVSVPGISALLGSLSTDMWRGWGWAFRVVTFVGLLALALLLVALLPKPFDRVSTMVETQVLTAAVDKRLGGGRFKTGFQWQWGDVENAMTFWSETAANKLSAWTTGSETP